MTYGTPATTAWRDLRVAALLVCALGALSPTASAGSVETFLRDVASLTADFEQEIYASDGELIEASVGTLAISRPGRFRWEYADPAQLIVADGERLWLYDIELDQVTVNDQDSQLNGSPAALLGGDAAVLDEFRLVREYVSNGIAWSRFEPLDAENDFEIISLGFLGEQIAAMELTDALGQLTRVRFSSTETNIELPDSTFVVEIPEGVDVIDRSRREPVAEPAAGD